MQDQRALSAIERIDRALGRIEAAAMTKRQPEAEPAELARLREANAVLRSRVEGAIREIDTMLDTDNRDSGTSG